MKRQNGAQEFAIRIPDSLLDDLRLRLTNVRWPGQVAGTGWDRGVNQDDLRALVDHWANRYDWRRQEAALNRFDHYRAEVDGCAIHFIYEKGRGPNPLPLLVSHGWPGSFYEFTKLIPLLTDPAAHGRDARDAFDVVVPSLPGYAFSGRVEPPKSFNSVPTMWRRLMTDVLGYGRFAAHGDDIGAMVTNRLAIEAPEALVGIHVTFPPEPAFGSGTAEPSPAEQAISERRSGEHYWGNGYVHLGATRPQTLAYALADSPVGLAAFMLDKMREWSDCDGDLARRFTPDELLTWLSIYWLTGTAGSFLDPYWDWALGSAGIPAAWERRDVPEGVDSRPLRPGQRIAVPAGVAIFRKGPVRLPREWAERAYADLRRWIEYDRGGHFPAWEEPELLADDLRDFLRPLRPG